MRVIIRGNWANTVGTDYCDALGIYDSLADAEDDAADYAWNCFEEDENEENYDDEGNFIGEGPDYYIEEYDPNEHDQLKAGGGSFTYTFEHMEEAYA